MTPTLQHLDGRPQTWEELHRRNEEWWAARETVGAKRQARDLDLYMDLCEIAAPYFGLRLHNLLGRGRTAVESEARRSVWFALLDRGWSQERIAKVADRNAGTISHALKTAMRQVQVDEFSRKAVADMKEYLRAE